MRVLLTVCNCCCHRPRQRTGVFTNTDETVAVAVAASGCTWHITAASLAHIQGTMGEKMQYYETILKPSGAGAIPTSQDDTLGNLSKASAQCSHIRL